jgi:hypothetical protein
LGVTKRLFKRDEAVISVQIYKHFWNAQMFLKKFLKIFFFNAIMYQLKFQSKIVGAPSNGTDNYILFLQKLSGD